MYLGIPDARTIQETQKIQERQPREEPPVYLSDKFWLVETRDVDVNIVDSNLLLLFSLLDVLGLFTVRGRHFAAERKREGK